VFVLFMLCTLTDAVAGESPYLWRRYLPTLLAGLRPGGPELPGTALTKDEIMRALGKSSPAARQIHVAR
jgi:hypothetical protein